jgi:pimeloyl-ACP methyl ester carboxylesterase
MDEQFCDVGDDINLCYETFGERSDPAALLIMGLGTQMVAWHEDFCRALAGRGFYVVRFDNRDIGHSTHLDGLAPPTIPQLLMRSKGAAHYKLSDMAEDAAGLLRELDLSPAHVIGASMGGMIAQTLAARHPRRVRSLVSIMSNTGALLNGQPALKLYPFFLRRPVGGREQYVAHFERLFNAIGSRGLPREPEEIRELAAISYERDHDPAGPGRQLAAILASGDRTAELRRITAPTLVVHGTADPLVRPSGGRATARAIRGAKLMKVPGMGHDLPRAIWDELIDAIAENAARAGGPPDRHPPLHASPAPLSGLTG